jgi:carboxypeptidase Taq
MHMREEMDFEGLLRSGDISVIREYLKTNIHQYGKLKDSRQILKDVTGEDFNPQYYVDYLIEKYSKVYGV